MLRGSPWDAVRALGLPTGDYAVFGSAPLLACGLLNEVGDLDLLARSAAWAQARAFGEVERAPHGDLVVRLHDAPLSIDIFNGWMGLNADAIVRRATLQDGLPIANLGDVAHYKRLLRRPKDLEHLRLMRISSD